MQTVKIIIDLLSVTWKIVFIVYAWSTMVRLNAYIKEKSEDK